MPRILMFAQHLCEIEIIVKVQQIRNGKIESS